MAGLTNLVWHEHVWPKDIFDMTDDEEVSLPRYDACEDDTGRIFVWHMQTSQIVRDGLKTRAEAVAVAHELARGTLSPPRTE